VIDKKRIFGLLLDRAGDALPVLRSKQERAQDQQVESTLQEGHLGSFFLSGRHAT
jgi:hypothetical protein